MPRATRAAAVLFTTLLTLLSAAPALAADPVRRDGPAPAGSVEPTGVVTCDVRLSVVNGSLVDANFHVRDWEPFIVWGFGYPSDTSVLLEFIGPVSGTSSFDTSADSAGEFAEDFTFTPDPGPSTTETFSLTAEAVGVCIDGMILTVHPAYPFTDVDGFENEIAWLYREGITGGCTATRFCPSNAVTRGQMAAFLNRALGLPSTGTDFFDDDDGTLFESDINRLAASGITGGCATRRYCPNATVTRGQMAASSPVIPSSTDLQRLLHR